ncbi:MAG: phosphate acyltransferase PlsX [Acidimicrobiaceae bacterium]|nr:phosphate acyltransferase PlsX [Acidimicrobiaceae bacterium]
MTTAVAVDVEGGDRAPASIVAGIELALERLDVKILAVGRAESLALLGDHPRLERIETTEVIGMDEEPASSVRTKRDSSLVRCAELVRDKAADATFSAGNTGAAMASALFKLGRISRVSRPAIVTPIPVPGSTPTALLDSGANAECSPAWLVQFAVMGTVYAQERLGIQNPRVGLLSIGEEKSKGNSLVKEAHELLVNASGINFIGNVEGRDVMSDTVDVVVADGFVGNVVLKTLEGAMRTAAKAVLDSLAAGEGGQEFADRALVKLMPLLGQLSADTYGGAALLGVDGLSLIGHGSSGPDAVLNAILTAVGLAEHDLVGRIRAAIASA